MKINIEIRNPATREKTMLIAYSDKMAIGMIELALKDGWNVIHNDRIEPFINILREKNGKGKVNAKGY